MNTTFYKKEVQVLKEMAENIETHKPNIDERVSELGSKEIGIVIGLIGMTLIAMIGFLTWWLVT